MTERTRNSTHPKQLPFPKTTQTIKHRLQIVNPLHSNALRKPLGFISTKSRLFAILTSERITLFSVMKMTARNDIPVGQKPARCRPDQVRRLSSDPTAASPVYRIATRRPCFSSRVALRLLIAGSGVRPTGRGSEQFRRSRPVERVQRGVGSIMFSRPLGTSASNGFRQPTKAQQAGGCDGEKLPS